MNKENSNMPAVQGSKRKRWIILGVTTAVVVGLATFGLASLSHLSSNHAEELAAAYDKELVRNGAVKRCGYGDGGHGIDNREPWYNAYYELPLGREQAIQLVNNIASSNGYKLTHMTHASPGNKRFLAFDPKYADNWFFDDTSKASQYADLQPGPVQLAFAVNNDGPQRFSCVGKGNVTVNTDANHSMITVEVSLPGVK